MTGPTGAAGLPVSLLCVSLCPSVPTTKSRTKTHSPRAWSSYLGWNDKLPRVN